MSRQKQDTIYNWIAELARLLPEATFHAPSELLRDGMTRINVQLGDKNRVFIVAQMGSLGQKEMVSPQGAADRLNAAVEKSRKYLWVSRDGRGGSIVDVWTGEPAMEPGDDGHPYYRATSGASIYEVGSSPLHNLSMDELGYGECRRVKLDD